MKRKKFSEPYKQSLLNEFDGVSCGPDAIFNALKWAGADVEDDFIPILKIACQTVDTVDPQSPDRAGTYTSHLERVLRYMGKPFLRFRRLDSPTFNQLDHHIQAGGAVILCHYPPTGGHYVFIERYESGFYHCLGDYQEYRKRRRSRTIRKWIKIDRHGVQAWLINKKT